MITSKLAKPQEIELVCSDPEIYERYREDTTPPIEKMFYPDNWKYMSGYVDGELACVMIIEDNHFLHFNCLKEFRKHSYDLARECLKFHPYPFYAKVPECCQDVLHFSLNYGCKEIRREKDGFIRDGEAYDNIILKYEVM